MKNANALAALSTPAEQPLEGAQVSGLPSTSLPSPGWPVAPIWNTVSLPATLPKNFSHTGQLPVFTPAQAPPVQRSGDVQGRLSSHGSLLMACTQPLLGLQLGCRTACHFANCRSTP